MQIQINADEVFAIYKEQLGEMHHELILANLQIRKLKEALAQYEQAEVDRVRVAAAQRSAAQEATGATETALQPDAVIPPPPTFPAPATVLSGLSNGSV